MSQSNRAQLNKFDQTLLEQSGRKATSFFERVYELVMTIPEGKVATYGQLAQLLGTRDARRVGHALHANPYEGIVPCHRVVNKNGGLADNFAFSGAEEQRKRLLVEGVVFLDVRHVDMSKSQIDW